MKIHLRHIIASQSKWPSTPTDVSEHRIQTMKEKGLQCYYCFFSVIFFPSPENSIGFKVRVYIL